MSLLRTILMQKLSKGSYTFFYLFFQKVKLYQLYLSHSISIGNNLFMYLGVFLMFSVCYIIYKFRCFDHIFYQISEIDREIARILRNKEKLRNFKRKQIHFELIWVILSAICLIICIVLDNFTYPP